MNNSIILSTLTDSKNSFILQFLFNTDFIVYFAEITGIIIVNSSYVYRNSINCQYDFK